jgi:UDP-N-acetylglucosamine 2-epimerase
MRVLIVGEHERPHALAAALEAAGAEVARPPEGALGATAGDQVGELAAALTAFDRLLADDAPEAVLLVSATTPALAAVLVATKLQIPVAALVEAPKDRASELDARLIEGLANGTVSDDAAAITASLRELIAP